MWINIACLKTHISHTICTYEYGSTINKVRKDVSVNHSELQLYEIFNFY